jgi:hypothetical protein
MKLYYQISQIKVNGKTVKYHKTRSRSFVKAYMYGMFYQLSDVTVATSDIANASRNPTYYIFNAPGGHDAVYAAFFYMNTFTQVAKNGIVIGTGNTAVASTDYALETRIISGVASGQIEHFSNIFTNVAVAAPNASFTVNRIFRNGSGGSITIKEIGIYALSGTYTFCIVRDVLSVPVTMSDGDYLKITYTFQITA